MKSMNLKTFFLTLFLLAVFPLYAIAQLPTTPTTKVNVSITIPKQGDVVTNPKVAVEGLASAKGGVIGLDVILCLDSSGSLQGTDPKDEREKGAIALLDSFPLNAGVLVAVVDFDASARLVGLPLDPTKGPNFEAAKEAVKKLDQSGGTNIGKAIEVSQTELGKGRKDATKVIILFSDGLSDRNAAVAAANKAKNQGVIINTIFLGTDPSGRALMEEIATITNGTSVASADPAKLAEQFRNVKATGIDKVELSVDGGPLTIAQLVAGAFQDVVDIGKAGRHTIEAIATSTDGVTGKASVSITFEDRTACPVETDPNSLKSGDRRNGQLDSDCELDQFTFQGLKGQILTVDMIRIADIPGGLESSLDPILELLGIDKELLLTNDEGGTDTPRGPLGSRNAKIFQHTLPKDGTYTVVARADVNTRGFYQIIFTLIPPFIPVIPIPLSEGKDPGEGPGVVPVEEITITPPIPPAITVAPTIVQAGWGFTRLTLSSVQGGDATIVAVVVGGADRDGKPVESGGLTVEAFIETRDIFGQPTRQSIGLLRDPEKDGLYEMKISGIPPGAVPIAEIPIQGFQIDARDPANNLDTWPILKIGGFGTGVPPGTVQVPKLDFSKQTAPVPVIYTAGFGLSHILISPARGGEFILRATVFGGQGSLLVQAFFTTTDQFGRQVPAPLGRLDDDDRDGTYEFKIQVGPGILKVGDITIPGIRITATDSLGQVDAWPSVSIFR